MKTPPTSGTRQRRWFWLVVTFVMATYQILTALRVLSLSDAHWQRVSLAPGVELLAASLWAGVFIGLSLAHWRRQRRARLYSLGAVFAFAVYSVARLMIFARADYDQARWPFLVVALAIIAGLGITRVMVWKVWKRALHRS